MSRLLIASTVASFLEAFLLPYAKHFRDKGWRVDAMARCVTSSPRCLEAFDQVWDIEWSRNPLDPSNLLRAKNRVTQIVDAGSYDIVHIHTPVAGFICRYALRSRKSPVVIYTAHGFHFHNEGSRLTNLTFLHLEKLAGRWTDYLVVINRADEDAARVNHFVPLDRIIHMPGIGVDTRNMYNPTLISERDIRRTRELLNLPPSAPVILMLAEFIPRKCHADALRAFAQINRDDAHLLLAGTGPTMPAMIVLAHSLGIASRVHFLGVRRDAPLLIKSAQVLLLCSKQEGLPRSIMEALALGTPVVGSDIRGTRELLTDGAGYLYKFGDTEALVSTLNWVINHPVQTEHTTRWGRERIADYDIQNTMSYHEELYTRALQHEPTSPYVAAQ